MSSRSLEPRRRVRSAGRRNAPVGGEIWKTKIPLGLQAQLF